jgi:hypothetical protein
LIASISSTANRSVAGDADCATILGRRHGPDPSFVSAHSSRSPRSYGPV